MKTFILAASLLALSSAAIAADVGVSVNIGQPGFYGQIDIGSFPQPRVIYSQPMIIERPVRVIQQQPVYMRVPPGHAKKWSKHCSKYNACGRPVYFVQDSWYANEYAPRYRAQHGGRSDRDDHGRGNNSYQNVQHDSHDKHDKHDKRGKHDKHDKHGKHGGGKGNGNGNGNGKH